MSNIEIFTDGACKGNPGDGGWGAIIRINDHEEFIWGGEKETTNNRMEMMAAIKALNAAPESTEKLANYQGRIEALRTDLKGSGVVATATRVMTYIRTFGK